MAKTLTADTMVECLAQSLQRDRNLRRLKAVDRNGRLHFYYPVAPEMSEDFISYTFSSAI